MCVAPPREEHSNGQVDNRQNAADDEYQVAGQTEPFDQSHRWHLEERRLARVPVPVGDHVPELEHPGREEVEDDQEVIDAYLGREVSYA